MNSHDTIKTSTNNKTGILSLITKIVLIQLLLTSIDNNRHCQAFSTTNIKYPSYRMKVTRPLSRNQLHSNHDQNKQSMKKTVLSNSKEDDEKNIIQKATPYLTVMAPLVMVYISNQWSRSSIYYLVNFSQEATASSSINVDLGFSETEYGFLASIGFTALYAVASLFAGSISDSSNRKTITYASCAAWTLATVSTALATSYNNVLASRVFMGLSCAFTTPAAYTIIRDVFPKDQAAFASSIFSSAIYVAGALSSLTILLDSSFGWRGALYAISIFGLGAILASSLVLPNSVGLADKDDNAALTKFNNPISGAKDVLSNPIVPYLFLASFLRFSSGLTIGIWSAAYFRQTFPDLTTQYAVTNALIVGLCGVTSNLLGGYLADKFANISANKYNLSQNAGRVIVPMLSSLLAVPTWYLCIQSSATSFELAMIWLAVEYIVAECWVGPTIAILQSTVNKTYGGTAQGLFTLMGALANAAPALLGYFYQQQNGVVGDGGVSVLGEFLSLGVCGCYALSFLVFIGLFFKLKEQGDDALLKTK